jgi:hypothetical protein
MFDVEAACSVSLHVISYLHRETRKYRSSQMYLLRSLYLQNKVSRFAFADQVINYCASGKQKTGGRTRDRARCNTCLTQCAVQARIPCLIGGCILFPELELNCWNNDILEVLEPPKS